MNELIKIEEKEGLKTVNARNLWNFIESGQDFSHWITNRIEKYGFVENEDFTIVLTKSNGGRPSKEYHVTTDMAKELSMVERNEKGKQARQYFIECERQVKELTPAELILQQAQQLVDQENRLKTIESQVALIEAKQTTRQDNFFTVAGYCSLKRIQVSQLQSADLGRKCAKLSREKDYTIETVPDARFGRVNIYHTDILQEIVC